ncbi:MAG: hypothetical protein JSS72_13130 [Armatimonadetes bacterium]|nr:hypothetical protein [Armatimonadota bacterium]
MRITTLFALLSLAACLSAQGELSGPREYPQFRTLSALPGGLFGVLPGGKPDFSGAMAISTPIAYALGSRHFAAGLGNTSVNSRFAFFDKHGSSTNTSNGTGFVMGGVTTPVGELCGTYMVLSSKGDQVYNFQFSPRMEGKVRVGVGVQDAGSHGGASGDPLDFTLHYTSRSYYSVATADLGKGNYASVGYGDQRFGGVFGNVSAQVTPKLKALVEYDVFNWNFGLATPVYQRNGATATLFAGMIRGKYATWGLTATF